MLICKPHDITTGRGIGEWRMSGAKTSDSNGFWSSVTPSSTICVKMYKHIYIYIYICIYVCIYRYYMYVYICLKGWVPRGRRICFPGTLARMQFHICWMPHECFLNVCRKLGKPPENAFQVASSTANNAHNINPIFFDVNLFFVLVTILKTYVLCWSSHMYALW